MTYEEVAEGLRLILAGDPDAHRIAESIRLSVEAELREHALVGQTALDESGRADILADRVESLTTALEEEQKNLNWLSLQKEELTERAEFAEAQVAELVEASIDWDESGQKCRLCGASAPLSEGTPHADKCPLANLSDAARRHVERDKNLERAVGIALGRLDGGGGITDLGAAARDRLAEEIRAALTNDGEEE